MGTVWKAHDTRLKHDVALKIMPSILALNPEAMADLRREARVGLQLSHANILRTIDFVSEGSEAALVMEYVDGKSLGRLSKSREPRGFDYWQIANWISPILNALIYAHEEAKVVHRDLKPANVMIDRGGHIKIMDFGIAHSLREASDRSTAAAPNKGSGTLHYMSPQQLRGEPSRVTDDVYALGATLFELLSGTPPFYSGDVFQQVQHAERPNLLQRRAECGLSEHGCPVGLAEVIRRCLSLDAKQRPQSIKEIANDLYCSIIYPPIEERREWELWLEGQLSGTQVSYNPKGPNPEATSDQDKQFEDTFFGVTLVGFRSLAPPRSTSLSHQLPHVDYAPSAQLGREEPDTLAGEATLQRLPLYELPESRPTNDHAEEGNLSPTGGASNDASIPSTKEEAPQQAGGAPETKPGNRFAARRRSAGKAFESAFTKIHQGDLLAAVADYELAADNGHHGAISILEWLGDHHPDWPPSEVELVTAMEAVTQAHGQFLFDEGRNMERGLGLAQDLVKAISLYRQAAELNHPEALQRLGLLYLHGRGVPKDVVIAASLVSRAAELGFGAGHLQLGRLLEKGIGVQRDLQKARAHYEKALQRGEDAAADYLAALSSSKVPPPRSAFEKASDSGPAAPPGEGRRNVAKHVFVSYSRRDAGIVYDIVGLLRQQGINIWIDVADADGSGGIPAADSWPQEIVRQIRGSCMVVCMVTSNSVQSENVQREIEIGTRYRLKLVPAFLERLELNDLPDALQYYLGNIQHLPLYKHPLDTQAQRLGKAIQMIIETG